MIYSIKGRLVHHQDKVTPRLIVPKFSKAGLWMDLLHKLQDLWGGQDPIVSPVMAERFNKTAGKG